MAGLLLDLGAHIYSGWPLQKAAEAHTPLPVVQTAAVRAAATRHATRQRRPETTFWLTRAPPSPPSPPTRHDDDPSLQETNVLDSKHSEHSTTTKMGANDATHMADGPGIFR
jgi:hypothetical protein